MLEAIRLIAEAGRLEAGLLLFPVGLAVGSFCGLLLHRMPRGESLVRPRSRCPRCQISLRPADLVPVLSWVRSGGRCRYCLWSIPWRYPAQELGCGVAAAAAGLAGGWPAGLGALLLWVGVTALWGQHRTRQAQAGSTLVEILLAVALLVSVAIPMLELGAHMRGATPFQRQIAVSLAASKIEELGNIAYRTTFWPGSGADSWEIGRYSFERQWVLSAFSPTENDYGSESSQLKQATVTVTCTNCTRPMPPVRMVAVLAKL